MPDPTLSTPNNQINNAITNPPKLATKDQQQINSQANPQVNAQANPEPNAKVKSSKRIELETLIREFQSKLGKDWEKYHETLSYFLVGKLSRPELVSTITPILREKNLLQYHNKLLLLNFANSLKDGPLDSMNEFSSFWNKKVITKNKVKSTQYEKFKSNIMSLPIKERRRIKNITRDSGKKNKLNASITLTRHSMLPKIPMIQDKEQQQLNVNSLVQWQSDIVNGINTPLSSQNYELPDKDQLTSIVKMISREYGLVGSVQPDVLELISLGLESYLKQVVESMIDCTKFRQNRYWNNDIISFSNDEDSNKRRKFNDTNLSIEDFYNTYQMFPHLFELGDDSKFNLLQNDDQIVKENEIKATNPVNIDASDEVKNLLLELI